MKGKADSMHKIKQICKDSQKFQRKIINKQFLLGKYFEGSQTNKPINKKYTKSKIEKLLNIQQKIAGKEPKYQLYLPLQNLWQQYIKDLLKNDTNKDAVYLKLLRADYHGAYITVIHSKINSYIGLEGIIINESLKTFKIITKDSKILMLLKPEVVFQVEAEGKYYAVNANCLIYRSVDRAKIKFKNRPAQKINLGFMAELMKNQNQ